MLRQILLSLCSSTLEAAQGRGRSPRLTGAGSAGLPLQVGDNVGMSVKVGFSKRWAWGIFHARIRLLSPSGRSCRGQTLKVCMWESRFHICKGVSMGWEIRKATSAFLGEEDPGGGIFCCPFIWSFFRPCGIPSGPVMCGLRQARLLKLSVSVVLSVKWGLIYLPSYSLMDILLSRLEGSREKKLDNLSDLYPSTSSFSPGHLATFPLLQA